MGMPLNIIHFYNRYCVLSRYVQVIYHHIIHYTTLCFTMIIIKCLFNSPYNLLPLTDDLYLRKQTIRPYIICCEQCNEHNNYNVRFLLFNMLIFCCYLRNVKQDYHFMTVYKIVKCNSLDWTGLMYIRYGNIIYFKKNTKYLMVFSIGL